MLIQLEAIPINDNNVDKKCSGRRLISDPLNSKRRGTDAIRAEALLMDFHERAFISLRKSTLALFKFSLFCCNRQFREPLQKKR